VLETAGGDEGVEAALLAGLDVCLRVEARVGEQLRALQLERRGGRGDVRLELLEQRW